jgi:large subunit ribosomal protein L25
MQDISELNVEAREGKGKGAARALRRLGRVPAVVYGNEIAPTTISISRRDLEQELARGGFQNRLLHLKLEDKSQRVLPREVQFHVVTDVPIHVDFLRLAEDAELAIMVPTVFINEEECEGLRRGGVLNVVRHEIEVMCRADAIPETIECDLTGLDIGDSIHISAISLPDGVAPTITDRDFTIATIAAPSLKTEEEEAAEAEEGEEIEGEEIEGEGEVEGEGATEEEASE